MFNNCDQISSDRFIYRWHMLLEAQEEEKEKVVAAVWMTELIQFLAALAIMHQDERMNKKMATWLNGCFEK